MYDHIGTLSPQEWDDILASVQPPPTPEEQKMLQRAWKLRWERLLQQPNPMTYPQERFQQSHELLTLLARIHLGVEAIVTGLMVEPIQVGVVSLDEIEQLLGQGTCKLCKYVTDLPAFAIKTEVRGPRGHRRGQVRKQAEMFREMLLAMTQDLRVVLVLLIVGVHRLRHLVHTPVEQQMQVAQECREIYAPLANRLGISWLKNELEDLTFRYLYPHDFYSLVKQIDTTQAERVTYIEDVQAQLNELIEGQQLPGRVMGRPKHLNSIFRKMNRRQLSFDELFDIIAFRMICQSKEHCYQLLGAIHDKWKPIPGRFKDYIALPKSNMYQSLHTTVLGPKQKRMEIQIRTEEMHRVAEDGIAAHWIYKEGDPGAKAASNVQWLRSLLSLQDEKADADAFVANVRDHLFVSKVFVFTPGGDIKELRRGATPLDFAYAVHSQVGHHCSGAKVNGRIVPLRYELRNGDIVEIMTSPSARPNRDWLEFVQSGRAKNKIRAYIRTEQREQAIADGRERLERGLPTSHRNVSKLRKNGSLDKVCEQLGLTSVDELLAQIGYSQVSVDHVVRILVPPETQDSQSPETEEIKPRYSTRPSSGGILVEGLDDIMVRMARCCHPIPGDPIVGFVSRGRGVIVHHRSCPRLQKAELQRQIEVKWADDTTNMHSVSLRIITENRSALLAQLSKVFEDLKIQISRANCRVVGDESINLYRCHVSNVRQLKRLLRQLGDIRGVIRVERLRN